MSETRHLSDIVPLELAGRRVDQVLARMFPDYSRSQFKQWLKSGTVTVEGRVPAPKDKVAGGERVAVEVRPERVEHARPQAIPLDVVYRDEQILVVNKPAGMVVHPAAGNPDGTLLNALLHLDPDLEHLPRAGIVHRLDKDTTGLMVVARTLEARTHLVEQLQQRTVKREYEAVVVGELLAGGTVDAPIGRHPVDRKRMAVVENGKPAVTHVRVMEGFPGHTWVRATLETGRTHQIRVHMAYAGHPLVGDPVYGGRFRKPPGATEALIEVLRGFPRQALHARRLGLIHPATGEAMEWECYMPEDMEALILALREDEEARFGP